MKQSGIMGHSDETNLSKLFVSHKQSSQYYGFACSQSGTAIIMNQNTKKLVYDFKMNGTCEAACFSPCERYLYTVGDQAEIYQWDLNMRKCINKI